MGTWPGALQPLLLEPEDGHIHLPCLNRSPIPPHFTLPIQPFTYVARDGVEYIVPKELLPSAKAWRSMSNNNEGVVHHEVRLERKQRNLAKLLAAVPGTRLVRLFKAKRTDLVEISLGGAPGEPPVVCAMGKSGLAQKSKRLFVGDEVIAINGVPTRGHEATRLRLSAGMGELYLSVRRHGGEIGSARRRPTGSQQLWALLGRTLRVQRRQRTQAALSLLVPLACIGLLVGVFTTINAGKDANIKATVERLRLSSKQAATYCPRPSSPYGHLLHAHDRFFCSPYARVPSVDPGHYGCTNATAILYQACDRRSHTKFFGTPTYPANPTSQAGGLLGGGKGPGQMPNLGMGRRLYGNKHTLGWATARFSGCAVPA